jgi:two-component system OmpR family response regulator
MTNGEGSALAAKKILLVDDEPVVTRLMSLLLRRRGYEVRAENDSTKALEVAEAFRPDVIILDIIMPKLDGGELALLIQQSTSLGRPPLLFLSASCAVATERKNRQLTFLGFPFLEKPAQIEAIAAYLQSVNPEAAFGAG